jgi:exodeoxyribonuclease VII small subunit
MAASLPDRVTHCRHCSYSGTFNASYNITMPEENPLTFETGLQQLEAIVKEMEGGELPLERALELFERGMKLSETCRKQLEEAETRVEVLMRRGSEVQAQPFRPDK